MIPTAPDLAGSLTRLPPQITLAQAQALVTLHYGLTGDWSPLTSERDLNYHLTTAQGDFVVKFANQAEPAAVTDLQTQALLHLQGRGLPVPEVRRALTGASAIATPQGTLRLLTWLHGTPLHLTRPSAVQRAAMGSMAARLTTGLHGYAHPAARHVLQWDIRQAAALAPLIPAIPADLRPTATRALAAFLAVEPALTACRWQIVHNDLNPHNVLANPDNLDQIAGILDFGDMVDTPLICDLAVTAAYQIDPGDPLTSLRDVARAYHAILPLTKAEAALLPTLTATRMLTTLAITSARAARYPGNAPYILRNYPAARDGLLALQSLPAESLHNAMRML